VKPCATKAVALAAAKPSPIPRGSMRAESAMKKPAGANSPNNKPLSSFIAEVAPSERCTKTTRTVPNKGEGGGVPFCKSLRPGKLEIVAENAAHLQRTVVSQGDPEPEYLVELVALLWREFL